MSDIISKDVKKCLKNKNPIKTNKAPMQIVGAGMPMDRVAVDILGSYH